MEKQVMDEKKNAGYWVDDNGIRVCVMCSREHFIQGQAFPPEYGDQCDVCGYTFKDYSVE